MISKAKRGGDPTAVSLFILLLWTAVAFATPPTIELPKEVKGEPISFIKLIAKTDAKAVRWVALDTGISIFPSAELKDQRNTVVIAKDEGSYRILAYTGNADGPSEPAICTVIIGTPKPPTPPVPPGPVDPLVAELKKLYDDEKSDSKAKDLDGLISVYKQIPDFVDQSTNIGILRAMIRKASQSVLTDAALMAIRKRIQTELEKELPTTADYPIEKDKVKTVFAKYEKLLRAVGGK